MSEFFRNPEVREVITEVLTRVSTHFIQSTVTTLASPKTGESQSLDTPKPTGSCITCSIYQEVSLARGYIVDLLARCNPDGSIPSGLGGTLRNAKEHVDIASQQLPKVMGVNPKIDQACEKLVVLLPTLSARLEFVSGKQDLQDLGFLAQQANDYAYMIPEAVYRRFEIPEEKSKNELEKVLPQEDIDFMKKLREISNSNLSKEERTRKLEELMFEEGDKLNGNPEGTDSPDSGTAI